MKKLSLQVVGIVALLFSFFTPVLATETYRLDPQHTYVLWHIDHLGFSIQTGKFTEVEGTLVADESKPENSKIKVIIHTDKIVTGIAKLDEHLATPDFLNVAKYPTATFVSDKVVVTGKNTGKVYGVLTLLGVSKPVTLDVKLLKSGLHPNVKVQSLGFMATTQIKRSDFGMNKYLSALGDEVQIDIGAEANIIKNSKDTE